MCHGYYPHDHDELAKTDDPDELEESEPAFLNDEASVESELLTDGGNEDDE